MCENKVKRTERGWAGHFICADRCLFRRNTLLEYNKLKIIVSTVGGMVDIHAEGYPNKITYTEIGDDRYFETGAFHAKRDDTRYFDADVNRSIPFKAKWAIKELDADDKANEMHEQVVEEITQKMIYGEI